MPGSMLGSRDTTVRRKQMWRVGRGMGGRLKREGIYVIHLRLSRIVVWQKPTTVQSDYPPSGAPQVVLVVKNSPANAGDIGEAGSIPGWEDPLEESATHSELVRYAVLRFCQRSFWQVPHGVHTSTVSSDVLCLQVSDHLEEI